MLVSAFVYSVKSGAGWQLTNRELLELSVHYKPSGADLTSRPILTGLGASETCSFLLLNTPALYIRTPLIQSDSVLLEIV